MNSEPAIEDNEITRDLAGEFPSSDRFFGLLTMLITPETNRPMNLGNEFWQERETEGKLIAPEFYSRTKGKQKERRCILGFLI